MLESQFNKDLSKEKMITEWIVSNFYNDKNDVRNDKQITIINDMKQQHLGIDLIMKDSDIFNDLSPHNIDCKVAANYIKTPKDKYGRTPESLPTFAFELSYLNRNNERTEGWLFSSKYAETEYYMLGWVWADVPIIPNDRYNNGQSKYLNKDNIEQIEVMILSKLSIQNYVRKLGINEDNFNQKALGIIYSENTKQVIDGSEGNARYVYSKANIKEQPVNIIINKKILRDLSVYNKKIKKR